jgi:hypothetical protein
MDPVPQEVRRILEAIDSIDQLEILRILDEDRQRDWSCEELGEVVQSTPDACAASLAVLQGRGLVQRLERDGRIYGRYGAATPELEELLRRLMQLYRERPVTMIKLVQARDSATLRIFANAFRIRKDQ